VVHDAVEAVGKRLGRQFRTAAVLVLCGALLGACGSSSSSGGAKQQADDLPKAPPVGSVRSADCRDWKKGTAEQRSATVVALRKFAGGPVGSSASLKTGPVLDDGRAYRVLQSYCKNYFARGFKLYKLYERAAAFVGRR
jgi:hypothetical protein